MTGGEERERGLIQKRENEGMILGKKGHDER
jgi:hypothetical protein